MDSQTLLTQLFLECEKIKASDIHLSAGMLPLLRVDGDLRPFASTLCTEDMIRQLVRDLLAEQGPSAYDQFVQSKGADFSFQRDKLRYRANAFIQLRGTSLALRPIAGEAPTLASIHAPEVLSQLSAKKQGLILITGATGSGKTTTLAALIRHINEHSARHIISIEDPIEFIHPPQQSLVQQRELGRHCHSYSQALREALRQDPDVIVLGEMRDLDSIRLAISAGLTGHLVLSTIHSNSAAKTIDRIVDSFPAEEKSVVRSLLAECLQAICTQVLLPCVGTGRVAAHEVLVATDAVRNLIRENKGAQLLSAMQTGQLVGMQTLAQSVQKLVAQSLIRPEAAQAFF